MSALNQPEFERRWVAWRGELRTTKAGKQTVTKVPYMGTRAKAKANDPRTWVTRPAAERVAASIINGHGGGVGTVLGDLGDGWSFCGVDLDTCMTDGQIEEWAAGVIARFSSYTEISPSGTGAKVFFKCQTDDLKLIEPHLEGEAKTGKKFAWHSDTDHPPAIEMFVRGRYFAVTDQWLDHTPNEIVAVPIEDLLWLLTEHGPEFVQADPAAKPHDDGSTDSKGGGGRTNSNDKSRSAAAYRIGCQMRRDGKSFEEFIEALCSEPEIADWYEEKGKVNGNRETKRIWNKADPEVTGQQKRPVVKTWGGGLPTYIDKAEKILVKHDTELFQRGDFIVRPAREMIAIADHRQTPGMRLVPVGTPYLAEHLTRLIDFQRFDARSQEWVSINCPTEISATYLARVGKWGLRPIAGIINCPTLRPDGSILEQPGYDPTTKLLYTPSMNYSAIPSKPTKDQARAALAVLSGLIDKFPFVGKDGEDATGKPSPSRSVALSTMMTAVIRRSIPHAPMHAFDAPVMGSGKSMLVDITSMIATGHAAPVITQGRDENEMEKRLGAMLLAGDPLISFDNCEQPLGGELLCQALTQSTIKVRILGKSETPTMPSNATYCATGNNLVIAGDMIRRTIMGSLDPRVERPELRQFNSDPIAIIRADRDLYVSAVLVVLRAYVVAGMPAQASQPLGSFEEWSRLVRDALLWLDEPDVCDTMEKTRVGDPELQALGEVLHHWHEEIGNTEVSVKRVIEKATEKDGGGKTDPFSTPTFKYPDFREALLVVAEANGAINSRRLGAWLSSKKGKIVNDLRVEQGLGTTREGTSRWRVQPVKVQG